MFQKLNIFQTAHAMAVHAGARQAVSAANIANADTPGYRARSIAPFEETWHPGSHSRVMRASRETHLNGATLAASPQVNIDSTMEISPNGNSVSLEREMMQAAGIQQDHDRAIAIYKSAMTIMRASLGRR